MKITTEITNTMMGNIPAISFAKGTCHMIPAFGNIGVIETGEGLVLFDLPLKVHVPVAFKKLRAITDKPIKYVIYSHGHPDHAYGWDSIIEEIKEKGWDMPEVIAHENCIDRFDKYRMLDEYHEWLNQQQFSSLTRGKGKFFPVHEEVYPSIVIKGKEVYKFKFGGIDFELYPEKGETDDALWLWVPEKELICAGDLMVSHFPNVGNPFKVQRYPKHWALALERMMEKKAKYMVPGHGAFVEGTKQINDIFSITAEALHFVHDEVVKRMNEGKWFEQIFHEMIEIFPEKYKNHDYLQPIYGCYEFAVHAVYRLYHGWYNTGNPTDLYPAKSEDIAKEYLKIADASQFLKQAKHNIEEGKLQLALHLLDVIIKGTDENDQKNDELFLEVFSIKSKVLKMKSDQETSFIASNIVKNGATALQPKIRALKKRIKNKK